MVATNEKSDKALTYKQEKFCQSIVGGMTQSDAYRQAYSTENKAVKTVHETASRLMTDSKVVARLEELRAPAVKKAQRSYEQWLRQVEEGAFVPPEQLEVKTPDMLKALEVYGKATGFYQEKVAPPMNPLESASTEVLVAMIAEVRARRKGQEEAEVIEAHNAARALTEVSSD